MIRVVAPKYRNEKDCVNSRVVNDTRGVVVS